MGFAVETLITEARVREALLRQHAILLFDEPAIVVLATALCAPRLWGAMLDRSIAGFQEGLERPHDGRLSTRLHQAFDSAQRRVRGFAQTLIERRPPDVGLLALGLENTLLHVLCVGPARAYLHRRRNLRRLTPKDDRLEGVLKAAPTWCAEPVERGDLVFAGSLSAVSDEGTYKLRQKLESGYALPPRSLVEDLNKPAAAAGVGAAALAFRTNF